MKFQIKNNWFWYSKPNETNRSYRYHHICKCTKVPRNGQMYCIFFILNIFSIFLPSCAAAAAAAKLAGLKLQWINFFKTHFEK